MWVGARTWTERLTRQCLSKYVSCLSFQQIGVYKSLDICQLWRLDPNKHRAALYKPFSKVIDLNSLANLGHGLKNPKREDLFKLNITTPPMLPTINIPLLLHTRVLLASNLVSVFLNKISPDKHDGEPLCFRAGYSENDLKKKNIAIPADDLSIQIKKS